ncbi:MAG: hypothetical protein ACT4O6_12635 [Reyranella sp.]
MPPNDIPPLDDPAHDPVRGELARLFICHKGDLGLANHIDADIVARVDDIAALMMERYGRALLAGDAGRDWIDRYAWFGDACDRLYTGQSAVVLDG